MFRPSLPITPSSWAAIYDVLALKDAKWGRHEVSVMIMYAHFQALQGIDPTPVLERVLENIWLLSLDAIPDVLKPTVVRLIRLKAEEGLSWSLILNLLKAKETDLLELINVVYNSPESNVPFSFSQVVPFLIKNEEYRDILERAFPQLQFSQSSNVLDLYWRWNPVLVGKHLENVAGALRRWRHGADCIFLNDLRLMSFFGIVENIREIVLKEWASGNTHVKKNCLHVFRRISRGSISLRSFGDIEEDLEAIESQVSHLNLQEGVQLFKRKMMEPKLAAQKMAGLCQTSPLSQVFSACLLLVKNPNVEAHAISMISAAASWSEAADFISAHSGALTTPVGYLAVLRFYWKYFLAAPNEKAWCLLQEASTLCHAQSVRRTLRVEVTPKDYAARLVDLVWGRLQTETEEWKHWFIRSVPKRLVESLTAETLLQMVEVAGNSEIQFVYFAWLVDPNDVKVTQIIEKRFRTRKFVEEFVRLLVTEAVEAKSVEVLDRALASPFLVEIRPDLVYRLQLLRLQLSSPEDFPAEVLSFLGEQPDPELRWPLIAQALVTVVKDCGLPLLNLLSVMSRLGKTRVDRVLCACLLPRSVPWPGPYVRDPDVKAYEDLVRTLRCQKDSAVDVHLHIHLNNRV